jgi:phosphoribosylamine--glycine ligase
MKKHVLIIGSGGREHALAWKLAQSPQVENVFVAPGNGGTESVAKNVPIAVDDFPALITFAKENKIDLTVIGPDDSLAAGIVDAFQKEKLLVFGPTQAAATIEASKAFAKEMMEQYGIPTAAFKTFTEFSPAWEYAQTLQFPCVVKASGLALGKGVSICATPEEAEKYLQDLLVEGTMGEAGKEVVIEEFLQGPEISIHAITDGVSHVLFPAAQDHKPVGEENTGPNTGGMGTYAPVPFVTDTQKEQIEAGVVIPILSALRDNKRQFEGCLFPGLKLTALGPRVLEFNARFGDPETQSYMRLLQSDLYELLEAAARGSLKRVTVEWNPGYAACIILASQGYPGSYEKGKVITGIAEAENIPGVVVFHAGTKKIDEVLQTSGGRVLGVSAVGATLEEALTTAYQAIEEIHFEGKYFRKDIGRDAL